MESGGAPLFLFLFALSFALENEPKCSEAGECMGGFLFDKMDSDTEEVIMPYFITKRFYQTYMIAGLSSTL